MAVAGRRDLGQEIHEGSPALFALQRRQGIFRHLLLKKGDVRVPPDGNSRVRADQDALPAPHAFLGIDGCLFILDADSRLAAVQGALAASDAFLPLHFRR